MFTERLQADFLRNPQVTVYIEAIGSKPVEVYGAVSQPGVIHLRNEQTTLVQVLGEAGGIDKAKRATSVIVRRADDEPVTIDLEPLFMTGQHNMVLRAGDIVFVPEALVVYVAGDVKKPGTITWSESLSVSQALTQAGGPGETASLRNAYILRDGERVSVNLRRIFKGSESDVTLEPNDQLFLRRSVF